MKLFISYSSQDKSFQEEVSGFLQELEHKVWADKSLKSGQEWWSEILDEIRKADVFICILSNNYNASEACSSELSYAVALNKFILPIKVESLSNELLPYELGKLQVLDYYSLSTSKRITKLVNALTTISALPDYPRQPPSPLPEEPSIPISYKTRIFNRLDLDDELDVKTQNEIISELRKAILNNHDDHAEIKTLLQKMLKRGDEIRLNISYDIKELLDKIEHKNKQHSKLQEEKHTEPLHNSDADTFKTSNAYSKNPKSEPETNEGLNIGLQMLSFLIPIAGIILFFIYREDAMNKANRALTLGISGLILFMIVGVP